MKYGIINGQRSEAFPHAIGQCPQCKAQIQSKCGPIVSWHWAHINSDCDPWSEPESQWHLDWKSKFPIDWQEVVVGCHRADVKTPKMVIEFQSSSISADEIVEREKHYGKMAWVINAKPFWNNIVTKRIKDSPRGYTFRWKWPRLSWFGSSRDIFLDAGFDWVFQLKKVYWPDGTSKCAGWGNMIFIDELIKWCSHD